MTNAAGGNAAPLCVDAILAKAAAATGGLTDFGDAEFHAALRQIVDCSNRSTQLSPTGIAAIEQDLHRILINRLRFARDLRQHPEILGEDVSDPIIILGMPRTGTTKLQRMIAADPDVQRLDFWRLLNPAPFDDAASGNEDPRIESARQAVGMMHALMPDWKKSHATEAEEVDEECYLQLFTCKSLVQAMGLPITGYLDWFKTQSLRGTYRYMKQLLQYLQWQDGGKRGRPWILKSPVHMATVDLLLELFPKATLVFTHRDIHTAVASTCRLVHSGWVLYLRSVDPRDVGTAVRKGFIDDLRQHMRFRRLQGERLAILDVGFDAVTHEAITVIEEIHARAGRELGADSRRAMLAWEAGHAQHMHGKPTYSLADYGLSRELIDSECREYIEVFG